MHGEVDVGTEKQIMTTPKTQDLTIDEKMDETVLPDSQDTIPDDLILTLNVYSSKSIIVHPYVNHKIQTPIAKLRIRRPSKFKESPYTMKFGSTAGIHVENHPRYKDKDSSDMFDVLFQENLPQQSSRSLDCGVYMVTYVECLSYGHKILATEFDPNALRTRYAATLWDYGTRKQELNAHSDVETSLRPPRQSRITSVTEVFDV
ncbi:hypothetical protein CQW23_19005 [Capsicum baccatum]|uniref:Ubiquitin-like protease family profile domain-containing protein n=1 Tax=Capsicum baccatum TaxID=33114 RepID=A0A2G2W4J4_CAPBA|nr:hypothetical protein CQW23_19005 [Capsicum baccatum]